MVTTKVEQHEFVHQKRCDACAVKGFEYIHEYEGKTYYFCHSCMHFVGEKEVLIPDLMKAFEDIRKKYWGEEAFKVTEKMVGKKRGWKE